VETEGIVLREGSVSGNARSLVLLTAKLGKVTALARGAKSIRSSLAASCSQFVYSRFVLFCSQGRYTVDSAEPVELFIALRDDIRKLALAQYFAELSDYAAQEDMPAPEHLKLLANSLYILAKTERDPGLVKACFELRLMSICGYRPYLEGCAECGDDEISEAFFDPEAGGLVCRACAEAGMPVGSMEAPPGVIRAMRHILDSEWQRLFSFSLPESSAEILGHITERFVETQMGRSFPTLAFYSNLPKTS